MKFITLLILPLFFISACGSKTPLRTIAQPTLSIAQSIGVLQNALKLAEQAKILPSNLALEAQESLLQANDKLKPVPAILRLIQQNKPVSQSDFNLAVSVLQDVSSSLAVLGLGWPQKNLEIAKLIELIKATQNLVLITSIELGKGRIQ